MRDLFAWLPEDGAPCSQRADSGLPVWDKVDDAFFGPNGTGSRGGRDICAACPFSAAHSNDGVGPCATAAIHGADGQGFWWGIWGGLNPVQRARIAREWGVEVPAWVDGGIEAGDRRHGSPDKWRSCACDVCRKARSAYRKSRERGPRTKEALKRRADARRERYATFRSQGLSREEARRLA